MYQAAQAGGNDSAGGAHAKSLVCTVLANILSVAPFRTQGDQAMQQHSSATPAGLAPGAIARQTATWPMWRSALIGLWVVWAALLFGGFVLGDPEGGRIPTWCRLGSSVVLVIAGFTWFAATRGGLAERFAILVAIGMTLGLVGDWFNARNVIIGGIIAFGLGHVAYIAACVYAARVANLPSQSARWVSLAVWWLIGLVSWYFVVYLGTRHQDLIWPALPYTLLLAGTAGMATSLAVQHRGFLLLAVGAALFLVSDLVLAFRLFSHEFALGGDAVWLLYGPGQMLIVYALATARPVLEARGANLAR